VLPTDRRLQRYLFLSFCGRRAGLVCSLTRSVHFGPIPEDLLARQRVAATVDATLLAATRPGAALHAVFRAAVQRYAQMGFADEWRQHHQGGAAGYETREYLASPTSTDVIATGQVFAWNPSVKGAKSEDTIAVAANGNEILTSTPEWPSLEVEADGELWRRPAIRQVG
jgi:antitoxin VapB